VSEVNWLPAAVADIERLHAFLHGKNPQAAARAAASILGAARMLETALLLDDP
jgi:plasmid stabilization system protein ParE